VLALQGRDDPYGSLAQIEHIALPPAQITRHALSACGHSPHREQAALSTQLITAFLAPLA
jgi:pimeloyl-ACP methyl ester carboxylesterase